MSHHYEFLIDAPLSREELSAFLSGHCELVTRGRDRLGNPIWNSADFFCYISQPEISHLEMLQQHLRFTPTWRLESHFRLQPNQNTYPLMVQLMRQVLSRYDCNLAWLSDGSHPIFLKLDRKVTVQGGLSQTHYWSGYLHQVARDLGFPFDVVAMPSI